jgi:predicted dehydrogenase
MTNKVLKVAIIGAGTRGSNLALHINNCNLAVVVAIAEPLTEPREKFARTYKLNSDSIFYSWEEMAASNVLFDAAVITTLDNAHTEPSVAFLSKGCHLLIEKPMADSEENCKKILDAQKTSGKILAVCHSLRFTEGFKQVKELVSQGILGKIITINQTEEIGNTRFAHNYVRGKWGNTKNNTNLLLHKSCHDLDYIAWLTGTPCKKVSSFGSLSYFKSEMAPKGSADRCTDNCSYEPQCAYSALKLYINGDLTKWPANLITQSQTLESNLKAVYEGPFGRCVWHSDNDVVDHQVVAMEFECGATATFTMSGFTLKNRRVVHVQGTLGEIFMDDYSKEIIINKFGENSTEKIIFGTSSEYHPEDELIVENWLTAIHNSDQNHIKVSGIDAFENLKIAFAAEKSRIEGRSIEL